MRASPLVSRNCPPQTDPASHFVNLLARIRVPACFRQGSSYLRVYKPLPPPARVRIPVCLRQVPSRQRSSYLCAYKALKINQKCSTLKPKIEKSKKFLLLFSHRVTRIRNRESSTIFDSNAHVRPIVERQYNLKFEI